MSHRAVALTPIHTLKPSKRNARTHRRRQILQIAASIKRFGWTYPILADDDLSIIAGHGRYLAAIECQLKEVPVLVMTGLSDAEKRALAIADNKIAINAGWDRAALAAELGELSSLLPDIQLDLSITGFEPAEFDLLCSDFTDAETPPEDIPPLAATSAVSEPGDLWLMDCHRLCCGDARTRSDVRTLMRKQRAAMVFAEAFLILGRLPDAIDRYERAIKLSTSQREIDSMYSQAFRASERVFGQDGAKRIEKTFRLRR